jgi:general secretion pathway protein I
MTGRRGFTLLEIMVATLIMAIAVVGVLTAMSTSVRAASRLTAYDRAVMLGQSKMDELITDRLIPFGATVEGNFDSQTGWTARFSPYITRPNSPPGSPCLERVELEIWWMVGSERHTFPLEGYRRNVIPAPTP